MQEATQAVLKAAEDVLDDIIKTDNLEEAVYSNAGRIDDIFMHVLEMRQRLAEQNKDQVESGKLRQIQELIITRMQSDTPPEVQLLTQLVSASGKDEREQIMNSAPELVSHELVEVVDMLREQASSAGQTDLDERLKVILAELMSRLDPVGSN